MYRPVDQSFPLRIAQVKRNVVFETMMLPHTKESTALKIKELTAKPAEAFLSKLEIT